MSTCRDCDQLKAEIEQLRQALEVKSAEAARLREENAKVQALADCLVKTFVSDSLEKNELKETNKRLFRMLRSTTKFYEEMDAKQKSLLATLEGANAYYIERIDIVRAQNKSLLDKHEEEWRENNTLKDEVDALRAENGRLRADLTPTVMTQEEVCRRATQHLEALRFSTGENEDESAAGAPLS